MMASDASSSRSARSCNSSRAFGDALLQLPVQHLQLPSLAMKLGKDADLGAQQLGNNRHGDVVHRALPIAFDAIHDR